MSKLREVARKSEFLREKYKKYKEYKNLKRSLTSKYKLVDNRQNCENLVIILAGYKEFLWKDVMPRIQYYLPKNDKYEVCLVSSGKYSQELFSIAEKYKWSYLSLKRNNVSLALNEAIHLFPNAKYIYKIDEDMFLTDGFFEELKDTYSYVNDRSPYNCGFVAPLIPINGFGYIKILQHYNMLKIFEKKFKEKAKFSVNQKRNIVNNPEVAKFLWGRDLPNIDQMNKDAQANSKKYYISPTLFSIGAIYFSRKYWKEFGMFPVVSGDGMGSDEEKINGYTFTHSKSVIVSSHTVVGHFGYGPQTQEMKKYYFKNQDLFKLKK